MIIKCNLVNNDKINKYKGQVLNWHWLIFVDFSEKPKSYLCLITVINVIKYVNRLNKRAIVC